jgi:hypothetical protein
LVHRFRARRVAGWNPRTGQASHPFCP